MPTNSPVQAAPVVSVILPTYNRADLLPRAIDSVLTQEYRDLELVVIDNGSTPETQGVLSQIQDPRLRCCRFEQNRGVGGARNEGVLRATGRLIAFIDSDDVWLTGKLAYQVSLFDRFPGVDLILGNYRNFNHHSRDVHEGFDQMRTSLQMLCVQQLEHDLYQVIDGVPEAILAGSFFATPTVMLRASVFEEVGNFDVSLSGPEDFEFWCRAALRGVCMAYTTRPLIERFKDADSLSSQSLLFLPRYLRALDICEDTARSVGRTDLLAAFDRARARAWRGILHASALEGRRRRAWEAFRSSLAYGVNLESCVDFAAALAGPRAVTLAKRLTVVH